MGANVQPQGINVQVRGFLFNLFLLLLLSLSSPFLSLSHTPFFFLALSSSSNKTQPVLDSVMPMGVSFIICEPWRGRITQASAGKRNHETLSHSKRYWKKKTGKLPAAGLGRRASRPDANERRRPQQPDLGLGLRARGGAHRNVRERNGEREKGDDESSARKKKKINKLAISQFFFCIFSTARSEPEKNLQVR